MAFSTFKNKLKGQGKGGEKDDQVRLTGIESTSREGLSSSAPPASEPSTSNEAGVTRGKTINQFPRFVIRCLSSAFCLLNLIFLISRGKGSLDSYPGVIILQALVNACILCFPLLMAWFHCKLNKKGGRWVYKRELILDSISLFAVIITLWVSIEGTDCKNSISACGFVWPITANVLLLLAVIATLCLDLRAWYYTPPGRPQRPPRR